MQRLSCAVTALLMLVMPILPSAAADPIDVRSSCSANCPLGAGETAGGLLAAAPDTLNCVASGAAPVGKLYRGNGGVAGAAQVYASPLGGVFLSWELSVVEPTRGKVDWWFEVNGHMFNSPVGVCEPIGATVALVGTALVLVDGYPLTTQGGAGYWDVTTGPPSDLQGCQRRIQQYPDSLELHLLSHGPFEWWANSEWDDDHVIGFGQEATCRENFFIGVHKDSVYRTARISLS